VNKARRKKIEMAMKKARDGAALLQEAEDLLTEARDEEQEYRDTFAADSESDTAAQAEADIEVLTGAVDALRAFDDDFDPDAVEELV
jgi:hypothetical protein